MKKLSKSNRPIVTTLLRWFDKNARDLPWRRTRDPYAIWISEIMLQQTQVKTVIPYWERWMLTLPTVEQFAKSKPQTFLKLWEGLGYYARVHNAHKAAQVIVMKHGGKFPDKHVDVLGLPGIGRYTAGAICSIAFNQPAPILDGNVMRVLARVFGIEGNPKAKDVNIRMWKLAEELVEISATLPGTNAVSHFNQSLMELGALVCTPRAPLCTSCPLRRTCVALRTVRVEELPALEKRQAATQRKFIAFVVTRDNRWLVQKRPAGGVNAHLWEFPNVEVPAGSKTLPSTSQFEVEGKSTFTIRHSITRYRIQMDVYSATAKQPVTNGKWVSKSELEKLAFSSAHRQVANRISQTSA